MATLPTVGKSGEAMPTGVERWLSLQSGIPSSELSNAVIKVDRFMVSGYLSKKTVAAERDPNLKRWMSVAASYAMQGNIIAAQELVKEIRSSGQYEDTALPGLYKFVMTATEPPADDDMFIKADRKLQNLIANLDIQVPRYRECAHILIKAEMFEDKIALNFANQCLNEKKQYAAAANSLGREMRTYMNRLRGKA